MGLNLVIACHAHKVRRYMYRGHEDGAVDFYRRHWSCNLKRHGTVVLSDDQGDDPWIEDGSYTEEAYRDAGEKP